MHDVYDIYLMTILCLSCLGILFTYSGVLKLGFGCVLVGFGMLNLALDFA